MKISYTKAEFNEIMLNIKPRKGWDFSFMKTERQTVPWNYIDVVKQYITKSNSVLDIGTGGGEKFIKLAPYFKSGPGIDSDMAMIKIARQKISGINNVDFMMMDNQLSNSLNTFDIIINRHAPFNLKAIKNHLVPNGYFITQQVGEKNMNNIKTVLGQTTSKPIISEEMFTLAGYKCLYFDEYNVEYLVKVISSLVFWLKSLDMLHSDLQGKDVLKDVDTLNSILKNNVSKKGFSTNEHRYLAVAQI